MHTYTDCTDVYIYICTCVYVYTHMYTSFLQCYSTDTSKAIYVQKTPRCTIPEHPDTVAVELGTKMSPRWDGLESPKILCSWL